MIVLSQGTYVIEVIVQYKMSSECKFPGCIDERARLFVFWVAKHI